MPSWLVKLVLKMALVGFLTRPVQSSCTLQAEPDVPLNPSIFGLNDVMGPIVNLSFGDESILKAVGALGVQLLRHPGGTVANYWSLVNGSFVGANGTSADADGACSNGTHWNYCKFQDRVRLHPPKSFSAASFGKALSNVVPSTMYCLNVFSLSLADQLQQLDVLKSSGADVERLEMGNEFYLSKNYGWKYNDGKSYMEAIGPVIAHARSLFPSAKIGVVAANGNSQWNQQIAAAYNKDMERQVQAVTRKEKVRGLFDAVTIHKYDPSNETIAIYSNESQQLQAVAGWGEASYIKVAEVVRNMFPSGGVECWRTEFNFPTWNSGYPLKELMNGGLHGIYWASNVLAAIKHSQWEVPFPVVMLHAMLVQTGTGWDTEAGIVTVPQQAGSPDQVTVNGIAQIFSHMAQAATAHHRMAYSTQTGCPTLPISVDDSAQLPCLMAAVFSDNTTGNTDLMSTSFTPPQVPFEPSDTWIILNKCDSMVQVVVPIVFPSTAVCYNSRDAGGWAKAPQHPSELPWQGPLMSFTANTSCNTSSGSLVDMPPISLCFVEH